MEASSRPERAISTRINLEQSRKQAKDLVKAHHDGDARALDLIQWNHPQFHGLSNDEIKAKKFALTDAQLVIARTHHITSWPKLLEHVRLIEQKDPAMLHFEDAADAIINGDLELLRSMLHEHPELIRQRSKRGHHSTLLHYASANGVENYRQVTPANIMDVTRLLLDSGAEVDATSDAYGGGSTTLGLVATSAHPRVAGVQLALIDLLVERGAVLDTGGDGKMAHGCLANGCPEAAKHLLTLSAKTDNIYDAAVLGRVDLVQKYFESATLDRRERSMIAAAQCSQHSVVEYMLDHGVNIGAFDGMTALHWASANGDLPLLDLLIARGAPLEALNEFGGTVLSSTLWFAYNVHPADFAARNYPVVFDRLVAAGARTDAYPAMQRDIDGVREHAKRAAQPRADHALLQSITKYIEP